MKMPTFFASGDTPERPLTEGDYIKFNHTPETPVPWLMEGFENLYGIVQQVHLKDSIIKTRAPRSGFITVAYAYFKDEGLILQEEEEAEDETGTEPEIKIATDEDTLPEHPMEVQFKYFHIQSRYFRRVPPEEIPPEIPLLYATVTIAKPGNIKPDDEPDAPVPTKPGPGNPPTLPPNADALTVPDELPPPDLVSKTKVA